LVPPAVGFFLTLAHLPGQRNGFFTAEIKFFTPCFTNAGVRDIICINKAAKRARFGFLGAPVRRKTASADGKAV
jgi:hypothetical protein